MTCSPDVRARRYASFTFVVVRMRAAIRKEQNAADAKVSQRFADSMINYETVKYFDATSQEEKRRSDRIFTPARLPSSL